jgi:hypothetical protein
MIFEFKAPDGKLYEIQGPEGATPEQAFAMLQKHLGPKKPEPKSGLGLTPGSGLETAAVTAGSVGASFNEGLARSVDLVPQLGHWIRRQFNSDIPPLGKDPSGVRTGLKSLGIPVGTLEEQKKEYGVEEGPVRRIGGTAARIVGESVPFAAAGPIGPGLKATGLAAGLGAAGQEIGGDTGETIGVLASLPLALRRGGAAPAAPRTSEQLRASGHQLFDEAERAGVVISQPALNRLRGGVVSDMARQGMDDIVHPMATRVLRRLEADAARGPMTLKGAHIYRQVIGDAMQTAAPADARLLSRVRSRLDTFLDNLGPGPDVLMGDAVRGVTALRAGMRDWQRARKAETIQELIQRARNNSSTFSASGYENALRNAFRGLVNSPRRLRQFNQVEQAAIRRVSQGGPIGNLLRFFGRGAPKGAIMQAAHGANILSNPAVGIPLAAVTAGARIGATAATSRNARLAEELMRRGYPVPPNLRRYLDPRVLPAAVGATAGQLGQ